MTTAKKSTTTSIKSLCLMLVIMIMLMSSVECRALRSSSSENKIAAGCDQPGQGAASMGATQFAASSSNSGGGDGGGGGSVIRSLMFKLASGPSKRGPGH